MKEYDVFSMSGLDDNSVEEIAEKVNALTDSDKNKLFADCMAKMNINNTSAPERKITVKRSGIRRYMPVISTAACILIIAGVLFKIADSRSYKSEMSTGDTANNAADMIKDDTAEDSGSFWDGPGNEVESVDKTDDIQSDSAFEETSESSDNSEINIEYTDVFSDLFYKFDFANALVTNDPLEHENDPAYEKVQKDAVYQYYKVTDSRISSVNEIENIVSEVFSENYYNSRCNDLAAGEYPLYEENEDGLFTRAVARGWEYEWTDTAPEITDCSEESFKARKLSLFFGQEPVVFEFTFVKEADGWKIDSYTKDTDQ